MVPALIKAALNDHYEIIRGVFLYLFVPAAVLDTFTCKKELYVYLPYILQEGIS